VTGADPYVLAEINGRLALKSPDFKPLFADFSWKSIEKRASSGKKEGVIRACRPAKGVTILDATAGWGRDASLLAFYGAKVLMLERHPMMHALLADALANRDSLSQEKMDLTLMLIDAHAYLNSLDPIDYPDVIYLDPMHPLREKSALVKKDLQLLQTLIGPDLDALSLLQLALSKAKQRVVVKWPSRQAPLIPTSTQILGQTIRFDLYPMNKRVHEI
jgi:16S rRNA (guanine1516-N2)-methyltransferase